MSKIEKLKIKNFRGIKSLEQDFDRNFICLIGRGDSCKTTILEAISFVLSPSYIIQFYDTDFFNANINNSIEIEATLSDIPDILQTENKYGLYKRQYNTETKVISDEIKDSEETDNLIDVWTIKLTVDKNLEPKWEVIKTTLEPKSITATDRSNLNCFLISDYINKHFSWNKGAPLYKLLKVFPSEERESNIILDSLREIKNKIDEEGFKHTEKVIEKIQKQTKMLGININNLKSSIDFKDIILKDDKICLNDGNKIPLRLMGKGTKRIISIAIQLSLTKEKGIILIDEVEQGLEPDRIKQLVSLLKEDNNGQIFITTHSRDAVVELSVDDLMLVNKSDNKESISLKALPNRSSLQAAIRACPEAFFAKKVIICEGKTEIGICRSLDKWRQKQGKQSCSTRDCYYVLGEGNTCIERIKEIKKCNFITSVLMDSDEKISNKAKEDLKNLGVTVFDWEKGYSVEEQIFNDLPVAIVEQLIKAQEPNRDFSINENNKIEFGKEAKKKEWYKRIDKGELLGDVIFENWNSLPEECRLKQVLKSLSDWIDSNDS